MQTSENASTSHLGKPGISFLCDPDLAAVLPRPGRAGRFLPEWFQQLEREMGIPDEHGLPGLTVKACPPVIDAFSLGWVIPLACDVRIKVDRTGVGIQVGWESDAPFQLVDQHHPGQVGFPNSPFDRHVPLKWINPWRIAVPDGYSVLFTHPLNHFELSFRCFSGVVDCDRFHTTVNVPFVWAGGPGDVTIPRGTPIVQLIPFRRDALLQNSEARPSTPDEMDEQRAVTRLKYTEESAYARRWRVKK